MRMAKDAPTYVVASVDHALRLALVMQTEGPLRVSDAAARLGVAQPTAHRLLATLVHRDFAVQLPDRRYAAGPAMGLPAAGPLEGLRAAAVPVMEALVATVRETVSLAVLRGDRCVMVASVECDQALRVGNREGATFPAAVAAGGKAILATLSEEEVRAQHPAVDPTDLAAIRARGVAINRDRTEPGVTAVAVAIPGTSAALSLSMPSARFDERKLTPLSPTLSGAARAVGAALDVKPS